MTYRTQQFTLHNFYFYQIPAPMGATRYRKILTSLVVMEFEANYIARPPAPRTLAAKELHALAFGYVSPNLCPACLTKSSVTGLLGA